MKEDTSPFDGIMETIGNAGRYQHRFNYAFNFVLVIVATMPQLNLLLSLAVPDHWCHVPGREATNYTIDEWKNLTIPRRNDTKFEKCLRFTTPFGSLEKVLRANMSATNVSACNNGWEYNRTWYDNTAPMANDWVCDDDINTSNTLAMGRVGEVVGTLVFGYFADTLGRRPVFFATVVTVVVGRLMLAWTAPWIYAFMFFSLIGNLPSTSVFQGPLVIAMEISRAEDRAYINMLQCFGWNIGMVAMPLLMWWLRDWVPFIIITSLPLAIFLFTRSWMIESPRWLASKGKIKECLSELAKVAKTNGTQLPENAEAQLTKAFENSGAEENHSIMGLFSSGRLAKNTVLLVCCWSILLNIYICLTINVNNLDGNPFLNYLYQALAELPSYVIGKYVSDRYGRRWTSFTSFLLTSIACVPIIFIAHLPGYALVISNICIFLKFSTSLAFYSVNLQSMEIYPTCVRQTGISIGIIFGSAFGVLAPYIVDLGKHINIVIPYVIYTTLSVIAAACSVMLPETYGQQLPETLSDAAKFGADQDFWGRSMFQAPGETILLEKPSAKL